MIKKLILPDAPVSSPLFAELELDVVGQVIAEINSMKAEWRFAWPNYIL